MCQDALDIERSNRGMEEKGLRANAGKAKVIICGTGLNVLQSSGEFPNRTVCRTGVGTNSICCKH